MAFQSTRQTNGQADRQAELVGVEDEITVQITMKLSDLKTNLITSDLHFVGPTMKNSTLFIESTYSEIYFIFHFTRKTMCGNSGLW